MSAAPVAFMTKETQCLITPGAFGIVLMLEVRLALPIINHECAENVVDTVTDLDAGAVTDK